MTDFVDFTTYPRIRTTLLNKMIALSQRRFYLTHGVDITREQERLLRELRREQGLDQLTLADRVDQNKFNVSKTLKILEERGLITRSRHPTNRRKYIIYLTPDGEDLGRKAFQLLELWRDIFFKGFSREQVYLFRDLVCKSIANLEEYIQQTEGKK